MKKVIPTNTPMTKTDDSLDTLLQSYHYCGTVDVVAPVMEKLRRRPHLTSAPVRNLWLRYAAAFLLLIGCAAFFRHRYVENARMDMELAQMMATVYDFETNYGSSTDATYLQYAL